MKTIFSHYGYRFWSRLTPEQKAVTPFSGELEQLWNSLVLEMPPGPAVSSLLAQGLVREMPAGFDLDDVVLLYRRNPLENLTSVVYEFTTRCNFACMHCRMGKDRQDTETDLELLKSVGDDFLRIGISRFDFIGGEVSRFGDGWLQLCRHLKDKGAETLLLLTNGWFLDEEDFEAAGTRYANDTAYLEDLKSHGVTHVTFSVDGPEELHDRWRRQPGLYRRIMNALPRVRDCGLEPRVSMVVRNGDESESKKLWAAILEAATHVYPDQAEDSPRDQVARLAEDETNFLSSFIDVGYAVEMKEHGYLFDDIPDDLLRCKNFFRTSPSLRIRANGELAVCPLLSAGEGYGNLHDTPLIGILNGMADRFVFRVHAEKRIASYRKFVDRKVFGEAFEHICGLRTVLTLIARHMHEQQVPEDADPALYKDELMRINTTVARETGYLA